MIARLCKIRWVLFVLWLPNSAQAADSLIYFSGAEQENFSENKVSAVLEIADKLVLEADDALRLIVTKKYVDELKSGRGIEIILEKEHQVVSEDHKHKHVFSRLLIPFCRDNSCENKPAWFLKGNAEMYYTPPYINTKGGKYIEEIKQLIAK